MTKKELLNAYRAKVLELEELHYQIERTGTDGRPGGCRSIQTDSIGRGTNAPSAAAIQLAEGLEALASRKEAELQKLSAPVDRLLKDITDIRTYLVIQHYYVCGRTDEQIARIMSISRTRANQIRSLYMKAI